MGREYEDWISTDMRGWRKRLRGEIEQSRVMNGIVLNKDITHPDMRRRIKNPRIVLLDCPLEYKKGESQTNMEFSKESDWSSARNIEEEQVKALVNMILEFNPNLVITEKGVSGALLLTLSILCPELMSIYQDTAQFMLEKHNVSTLRRVRKSDNDRIALTVGANIINWVEDLGESDIPHFVSLFNSRR